MKKAKKIIISTLLIVSLGLLFSGCRKAATLSDVDEAYEKYLDDEIGYKEYLEVCDAYYNGDPLPKKGASKGVGVIVVVCVVAGGIYIYKKTKK